MNARPGQRLRFFQTLRFRLAALLLVVFGVILGGLCLTVLALREDYLREDFDERLLSRAEAIIDDIATAIEAGADEPLAFVLARRFQRHRHPAQLAQVRREDGSPIASSPELGESRLPLGGPGERRAADDPPGFRTIGADDGPAPGGFLGRWRLLTQRYDDPNGTIYYVQVAADLARVDESVRNLRQVFTLVIAVGLLVTGVASWLLAGRSLSPLTRLGRVAERLRADDLTQRLEQPRGEDEVATLVATFNRMLDRLSDAFHGQERFLADVAHELKTPLAVLLGEAQVLVRQDRPPEDYMRFVASVEDEVRSLAQTVDSLLALARADAGVPIHGTAPVSINEVVTDAVERCHPLAEQQEVRIVPMLVLGHADEAGPLVVGDAGLLRLMVTNLLRNAIRHSPPDLAVDVQVRLIDDAVEIAVRDRGPGIPSEYREKVFERFFRVPDGKAAFQGTGLGLTIVRGVARLHGGSVTVSNHSEGGCRFIVRLPRHSSAAISED